MSIEELDYVPEVKVNNFPAQDKTCLRSTLKTWLLDPTGVAGPTGQQIVGDDDPDRDHIYVYSLDQQILVSTDFLNAAVTTTASGQPPGQAIVIQAGASNGVRIYGNLDIWIGSITGQTVTRVCVVTNRRVKDY